MSHPRYKKSSIPERSRSTRRTRNSSESQGDTILSNPDKALMITVVFLVVIGIMAVFSATAQKAMDAGENPASYLLRQVVFIIIGIFGMRYFSNFDYKKLGVYATSFAWLVVVLLVLVDFTQLGVTSHEARRWMMIGPIQFQPSELAKLSVIMLLSNAFYRDFKILDERKFKYYIPIICMIFLIFKQPNLSMVILLMATSVVMYLSAGGSFKTFLTICAAGLTGLAFLIKPYQLSRLKIWFHPESDPYGAGYNIIQSKIAFAAGGLFGLGYGNSKQKLAWLPEGHTDFIFAVIAEEFGFIGCLLLIGLFLTLIHRGLIISSRCPDMYGKLLAVGITFSIGFQAFINMSVASSFLPATGVPLPFISYGGTSLVVTLCMMGILLNISRKRIKRIRISERR